jgi:hypothetical protein
MHLLHAYCASTREEDKLSISRNRMHAMRVSESEILLQEKSALALCEKRETNFRFVVVNLLDSLPLAQSSQFRSINMPLLNENIMSSLERLPFPREVN